MSDPEDGKNSIIRGLYVMTAGICAYTIHSSLNFSDDDHTKIDLPVTLKIQNASFTDPAFAQPEDCAMSVHVEDAHGNVMDATKSGTSLRSASNIPEDGAKDIKTVEFTGCAVEYNNAKVTCTSDAAVEFAKNSINTGLLHLQLLDGSIQKTFTEKNGSECWKAETQQDYSTATFEVDEHVMG